MGEGRGGGEGADRNIGSQHGRQRKMLIAAARSNVWVGGRLWDGSGRLYWDCRNAALCNLYFMSLGSFQQSSSDRPLRRQNGRHSRWESRCASKSIPHSGIVFGCFTRRLVDPICGTSHTTSHHTNTFRIPEFRTQDVKRKNGFRLGSYFFLLFHFTFYSTTMVPLVLKSIFQA